MQEEQSGRVSDRLLGEFITETRESNRIYDMRTRGLEDVIIGPPILGSTGAEIPNGDGLPMRDPHKGIESRFERLEVVAQRRTLSRPMRFAILSAAAVVIAAGIPDLIERVWP